MQFDAILASRRSVKMSDENYGLSDADTKGAQMFGEALGNRAALGDNTERTVQTRYRTPWG